MVAHVQLDFWKEVCVQESLQGTQFQLQLEKLKRRKPRGSGREVMKHHILAVNLSRLFLKAQLGFGCLVQGSPTFGLWVGWYRLSNQQQH